MLITDACNLEVSDLQLTTVSNSLDIDLLNILQDYLIKREQKQRCTLFMALGKQYLLEYLKAIYLDHFCSTYLCVKWFWYLKAAFFTGYADDNTPFMVRDNITDVIEALEEIGENLVSWFSINQMKLNSDKCHLLLNSQEPNALKIDCLQKNNSLSEKL